MAGIETVSAIITVADTGLKLAGYLVEYISEVREASSRIKRISNEIYTTSERLHDIGKIVQRNPQCNVLSDRGIESLIRASAECEEVLTNIRHILRSTKYKAVITKDVQKDQIDITRFTKLKWPWVKIQLEGPRAELQRIKDDLNLTFTAAMVLLALNTADKDNYTKKGFEMDRKSQDGLQKAEETRQPSRIPHQSDGQLFFPGERCAPHRFVDKYDEPQQLEIRGFREQGGRACASGKVGDRDRIDAGKLTKELDVRVAANKAALRAELTRHNVPPGKIDRILANFRFQSRELSAVPESWRAQAKAKQSTTPTELDITRHGRGTEPILNTQRQMDGVSFKETAPFSQNSGEYSLSSYLSTASRQNARLLEEDLGYVEVPEPSLTLSRSRRGSYPNRGRSRDRSWERQYLFRHHDPDSDTWHPLHESSVSPRPPSSARINTEPSPIRYGSRRHYSRESRGNQYRNLRRRSLITTNIATYNNSDSSSDTESDDTSLDLDRARKIIDNVAEPAPDEGLAHSNLSVHAPSDGGGTGKGKSALGVAPGSQTIPTQEQQHQQQHQQQHDNYVIPQIPRREMISAENVLRKYTTWDGPKVSKQRHSRPRRRGGFDSDED